MRLVLLSPHIDNLVGVPVVPAYMGARFSPKYNWMRLLADREDLKLAIYVDGEWTSAAGYWGDALGRFNIPPEDRGQYCLVDAHRWCQLSGFPAERIEFLSSPAHVDPGDAVVMFSVRTLNDPGLPYRPAAANVRELLARRDILKIAHVSHYLFNTQVVPALVALFNINSLIYESNLAKYPYFRKEFPAIHNVDIVPFAFKPRFQNRKPFAERKNRCVATGFTQLLEGVPIVDFYKTKPLHPIRWAIYNNMDYIGDVLDSQIRLIEGELDMLKKDFQDRIPLAEALSCDMAHFEQAKVRTQASYFNAFDIVDTFNDYRMFVVGEELCHSPGIGFVEGMACGSALLAIDDPMYRDLGLVPGEHYVAYDGSIQGLRARITYYQEHPDELAAIAAAGCSYVRERYTEQGVAEHFVNLIKHRRAELLNGPMAQA